MVEANGKQNECPKSLNRMSPGNRPIPSFSNHGNNAEKTISPIKMANTHRIICIPFFNRRITTNLRTVIPA